MTVATKFPLERSEAAGGLLLFETETHYIAIAPMIFNLRLVTSPKAHPMTHDRGWCYEGTGPETLLNLIVEAHQWGGDNDTEPEGWIKAVHSGERRNGLR